MAALLWPQLYGAAAGDEPPRLSLAERFVDAFYAFEPGPLTAMLGKAGESQQDMLFYQGWAEGGNYTVMERAPCTEVEEGAVSCSITVQDDLVLALGIDFNVTDTFTISFAGQNIASVETSSNDPQLYHNARAWVWENRADLVESSCRGTDLAAPDPGQCAQGMLQGYREYARLMGLEPREPD
jgi:hypothetical protein